MGEKYALLLFDEAKAVTEAGGRLDNILEVIADCGVIITSRRRDDAVGDRQELHPLTKEEAVKLLLAWVRSQVEDITVFHQICDMVGGLALAVRLVGRYLDMSGRTPSAGVVEKSATS